MTSARLAVPNSVQLTARIKQTELAGSSTVDCDVRKEAVVRAF